MRASMLALAAAAPVVVKVGSGPSALTVGLIAALGTLSGALIGGAVTIRVASHQRRGEQRQELVVAFERYMQASRLIASELTELPPVKRSLIDRAFDRALGPRVVFAITRLMNRLVYGQRFFAIQDEYAAAASRLTLVAPIEIIALISDIDAFFGRWSDDPGPAHARAWHDLFERLRLAAQTTVDAGEGRPWSADPARGPVQPGRRLSAMRRLRRHRPPAH